MNVLCNAGVTLVDPWGQEQKVRVRLFSYVVDNPEIADLWCTRGGSTKFPCEICFAPRGELIDLKHTRAYRTEVKCKSLVEKYKNTQGATAKEELAKKFSFHPVPSGLWGFAGGETELGSSSWAFTSDVMHNEDLGVFLEIIRIIPVRGEMRMCLNIS